MQDLAALKPLLTALIMPPTGPLLLVLWGLLCMRRPGRGVAVFLTALGAALLWGLSCNGSAVWLARQLGGQGPATSVAQIKAAGSQVVVVLGGGVEPLSPEYGTPQLTDGSAPRLRYGAHLARLTGLPLAYSGGVGWGGVGLNTEPEAVVAQRYAAAELGVPVTYAEAHSRDTTENAKDSWAMLSPKGLRRVVLVTHAWHMRRAERAYRRAGFEVVAAPMGFIQPEQGPLLEWLPSGHDLQNSRTVLREWLGYQLGQ